jgi:hypothetical protein
MTLSVSYPNQSRNYCLFDENRIQKKANMNLQEIEDSLKNPNSEEEVLEDLYAINLMLDNGKDKNEVSKLYPILSKYNDTKSPNIQTFLAGIYRKTKVPDAFGPLVKMLIQDSINPPKNAGFDPTEEIGGAILDYLA